LYIQGVQLLPFFFCGCQKVCERGIRVVFALDNNLAACPQKAISEVYPSVSTAGEQLQFDTKVTLHQVTDKFLKVLVAKGLKVVRRQISISGAVYAQMFYGLPGLLAGGGF
jgi:alpha-mannosidase